MELFVIGNNTNTTNIYNFQTNVITNGTSLLLSSSGNSAAAGNATSSIINTGGASLSMNIFTYINDSIATGTNFTNSPLYGSTVGNSSVGIFIGMYTGYQSYTYASNITSVTSNTQNYQYGTSSTGTKDIGMFVMGNFNQTYQYSQTEIYTYSSNTISNGQNLFNGFSGQNSGNAAGNSSIGVFNFGQEFPENATKTVLNICTYTTNTITTGTTLSAASRWGSATGNDLNGIFSLGNNVAITNSYNYLTGTVAISSNLLNVTMVGAATSNHNPGVNT